MGRIIIDQTKIQISVDLVSRGAAPFPRPLAWWQQTLPIWVSAGELPGGRLSLTPNGKVADGRQLEMTPALIRRELKAIRRYLDSRRHLDFADAIGTE
ncbi:hypothetical protein [Streptomyces sp. NPDC001781]